MRETTSELPAAGTEGQLGAGYSPTAIQLHCTSAESSAGDPSTVAAQAAAPHRLPNLERRARYCTDLARRRSGSGRSVRTGCARRCGPSRGRHPTTCPLARPPSRARSVASTARLWSSWSAPCVCGSGISPEALTVPRAAHGRKGHFVDAHSHHDACNLPPWHGIPHEGCHSTRARFES